MGLSADVDTHSLILFYPIIGFYSFDITYYPISHNRPDPYGFITDNCYFSPSFLRPYHLMRSVVVFLLKYVRVDEERSLKTECEWRRVQCTRFHDGATLVRIRFRRIVTMKSSWIPISILHRSLRNIRYVRTISVL